MKRNEMKKEMRIVGLGIKVIIQKRINGEWEQESKDIKEFKRMMEEEYAEYWNEYEKANTNKSPEEWFYHYGETEEMIRKGDAYVYR